MTIPRMRVFRAVCGRDREGIVGKLAQAHYIGPLSPSPSITVLNPSHTQKVDRHEVFDRRATRRPAHRRS